jgi:hypothetical protein
MRYFRLINVFTGEATGVFRKRVDETGLYLERFDPKTGGWIEDTPALAGYVYNGEVGAEEVTVEAARDLMARLSPAA